MTHEAAWSNEAYEILQRERDALAAELAAAKAIIAKDDTTESFKCSECGAWHVRKPTVTLKP